MFGISDSDIQKIRKCFISFPAIKEVLIYGSRAKGNYRPGSDIDLTINDDSMKFEDFLKLESELDDLMLPYKIDLSLRRNIENPDLLEHIERVGVVFYKRSY